MNQINALLSRAPGYSVAAKCIEMQAAAEKSDPTLRKGDEVQLHATAWSWFMGAVGEIEVGRLLRMLGPEWFVRHAVPIGTGTTDVDHLLIGPAGVFAINTKHHRGQSAWVGDYVLKVNGGNTNYLKSSRAEAENVRGRLTSASGIRVSISSVIVLVNSTGLTDIRKEKRGPVVIPSEALIGWLNSLPPALSEAELGLIRLAAEEPATWHIDPHAADTLRVMQRFERLRVAVGAAPFACTPPKREEPRMPSQRRPRTRPPQRSTRKRSARHSDAVAKAIVFLVLAGTFLIFSKQIFEAITAFMLEIAKPH